MPVRCRSWTAGVADDPLVVDRVVVAQDDRDRDAGRDADPRLVVVRVADPDRLRDRAEAAAHAPRPRRSRPGRATGRCRRPGRDAPAGDARPSVDPIAHGSGHRQRRRGARIRNRIPPIPPTVSVSPTTIRMKSVVRSTAAVAPGRSSPAMTRDGAPAPVASIARSKASCGAEASMRTLDSQPDCRHPAHALVGAQVVEQRLGRRGAVPEAQAVGAGRGGEEGRRAVGQQVDVGLDALRARSCRGPGSAAGPTGCRSGS